MASDEVFGTFVKSNLDAEKRWSEFDPNAFRSVFSGPIPEALIPLSRTPYFASLTEVQKKGLYRDFIKLNAEASLIFEHLLLLAFRRYQRRFQLQGDSYQAMRKLMREEFFHSRAFERFLCSEAEFGWPDNKLMIGRSWIRRHLIWVFRNFPLMLPIWAVKIEAYSIFYSHLMKKSYGDWDSNRWAKVHHLHFLDESLHIPVQIDVFRTGMSLSERLEIFCNVLGLYWGMIVLQCLLLKGTMRMVHDGFPELSLPRRIWLSLRVANWCVREFEPFGQARMRVKSIFVNKKIPYRLVFSLIHW